MKILEEIGIEVGSEAGIELLRGAGQTVDGTRVRLDRGFVMEQVAKAPDGFTLRPAEPGPRGARRRRLDGADAGRRLAVLLRPRARAARRHARRVRRS